MKGFKRNGKFIPITDYNKKGTRKSRDQDAKNQGVRMKRELESIREQYSEKVVTAERKGHLSLRRNWDIKKYIENIKEIQSQLTDEEKQQVIELSIKLREQRQSNRASKERAHERRLGWRRFG